MWKDRRGQTMIEFAILAPLFLLLLFGIIDLAWMFYVNLTMQHAVREGTRLAVTGRSYGGMDRRDTLIAKIREASQGLYDRNLHDPKDPRIAVVDPSRVNFDNYTGSPVERDPGGSSQIIMVSLTYTSELLTPVLRPFFDGGAYTFTVRSTMTNEPFDVSR